MTALHMLSGFYLISPNFVNLDNLHHNDQKFRNSNKGQKAEQQ
jgi:hypothetical protein